jgi:hypothetical protein
MSYFQETPVELFVPGKRFQKFAVEGGYMPYVSFILGSDGCDYSVNLAPKAKSYCSGAGTNTVYRVGGNNFGDYGGKLVYITTNI